MCRRRGGDGQGEFPGRDDMRMRMRRLKMFSICCSREEGRERILPPERFPAKEKMAKK